MPTLKTHNLFISHVWRKDENSEYYRLDSLLRNANYFDWRNYSVPEHYPLGTKTDKELQDALDRQIKPINCFVIVAGMYVNHRKWIQKELDIAISYDKPIVGVKPWGQERIPIEVQNVAKEMVGWNTDSIVNAIMSRKALVMGIDFYENISPLSGCVNDAHAVKEMLDRNADGSVNFGVKLMTSASHNDTISRMKMREAVHELFSDDDDVALLYFAGHGYIEMTGGYLCASDCKTGDGGLPLSEILTLANKSKAKNKIIILDSCHSGIAGEHPTNEAVSEIVDGVTILTASTKDQYASEEAGSGVFTTLLVDALGGAAANLVGEVTPGSVYAHIDQSLGTWGQRPVFKTNVRKFVSLRKVQPPLPLSELQRISEFFPSPGYEFQLDPDYEPEGPSPDADKTAIFSILQRYNRVNLLIPVGAPHCYHAAMESKKLRLTALGEHYRQLAAKGLI